MTAIGRRLAGSVTVGMVAFGAFGCAADDFAQLIVLVDSDLPPEVADRLKVKVEWGAGRMELAEFDLDGTASFPFHQGVLWGGGQLGNVRTEVLATTLGDELVPVSRVTASTRFELGKTMLVRLDLAASCAGVACAFDADGEDACVRGECVRALDPDVSDSTQATCSCEGCGGVCYGGVCNEGPVESVHAGGLSTCALHTSGLVTCWGDNLAGALGTLENAIARAQAKAVPGLGPLLPNTLAAGESHYCGISREPVDVWCWGDNFWGQLGPSSDDEVSTPVNVGIVGARDVDAGVSHTCAVDDEARVRCWGSNASGQLGVSIARGSPAPQLVPDVAGAVEVATGAAHTCVRLGSGEVRCWGDETDGKVGETERATVLSGASAITAGSFHTCAIVGGAVECWGSNANGALGTAAMTSSASPVRIGTLTDVVEISASVRAHLDDAGGFVPDAGHTCARTRTGSVFCWGSNDCSQTGQSAAPGPQQVMQLPGPATSVAAGGEHSVVLVGEDVWTWGGNGLGQYGIWAVEPDALTLGGFCDHAPMRALWP
jgi:hypothetical protein